MISHQLFVVSNNIFLLWEHWSRCEPGGDFKALSSTERQMCVWRSVVCGRGSVVEPLKFFADVESLFFLFSCYCAPPLCCSSLSRSSVSSGILTTASVCTWLLGLLPVWCSASSSKQALWMLPRLRFKVCEAQPDPLLQEDSPQCEDRRTDGKGWKTCKPLEVDSL